MVNGISKDEHATHAAVRAHYGEVVARGSKEDPEGATSSGLSESIGYAKDVLASIPQAANLGVGCGNPTALAMLQPGDVVVDLGSGAGLDSLLAAKIVGDEGRVIGVDMTPQMLRSARENAVDMGVHGYVEFREGLIEALPIQDESVDVVLSNCVINLSRNKPQVFREAYRVLKIGGRMAISDIVLSEPLPCAVASQAGAFVGCIAGAEVEDAYLAAIRDAGFFDVEFTRTPARELLSASSADPVVAGLMENMSKEAIGQIADRIWSYKITAQKP